MKITADLRESMLRGIDDLDAKIERAARPWVKEAHRHSQDTLRTLLAANPPAPEMSATDARK